MAFLKLSATYFFVFVYQYWKMKFWNYQQHYRYRKMPQILADKYTQETVKKWIIRCLLTMQIYSDSGLIFLYRVNDIAFFMQLCHKIDLFNFFNIICGFEHHFLAFRKKFRICFIENRYIVICLIISKIIYIDMRLPKFISELSA